ncbi:MAG: hypothetical protein ABW170_17560 [Candidatus Thiodiazotropha sp. L084R]
MLKLEQKFFPFKKTILSITDDRELSVVSTSLSNTTSFSLPIDQLTPRPSEHRRFKLVAVLIFTISLLVTIISGYILNVTQDPDGLGQQAVVAMLIFGTFTFVSLIKLQGAYVNLLIFNDRRTMDAIFSISPKNPSKKEVEEFVNTLESRIKAIEYGSGFSNTEMTAIYMRHLDFLLNEEVLAQEEYRIIENRVKSKERNAVVSLVK